MGTRPNVGYSVQGFLWISKIGERKLMSWIGSSWH
jgi:hypothetical protein